MNIDKASNYGDTIWDTWFLDNPVTKDRIKKIQQDKNKNEHSKRFTEKHMGTI